MALKQVYKAENELMANTIKDLLASSGIPALVHSFQIPAYDGIAQVMRSAWGEVLVDEQNLTQAKEIIEGFLRGESISEDSGISPGGDDTR